MEVFGWLGEEGTLSGRVSFPCVDVHVLYLADEVYTLQAWTIWW